MRERVAEEAADAHRDVDARAAQLLQRLHLQPGHAPRLGVPHGAHPEECQHLRDVVAVRAHRRGAPQHDRDRGRRDALLLDVARDQPVGEALPDLPRQLRRQPLGVDRAEVLAGGQHVEAPAGRRPRRTRRHVAPRERAHDPVELARRRGQAGRDLLGRELQDRRDAVAPPRPARRAPLRTPWRGPIRSRRAPRPAAAHAPRARRAGPSALPAALPRRPQQFVPAFPRHSEEGLE